MKHELRWTVEVLEGPTWVWHLEGDLFGIAGGHRLQEEVREKIAGGARRVVLDLGAVTRIDSAGIGVLTALMWSAKRAGGRLVLAAMPARIERVLEMTMLLEHFNRAASVEEATATLHPDGSR